MTEPTLARGHHNPHEWVVYAQKMINHARSGGMHLPMDENGVFDDTMEREVIGFQEGHRISPTGHVDHQTWAALHKAVEAKQRAAAEDAGEAEMSPAPVRDPDEDEKIPESKKNEEKFHTRTDQHGNTVRVYDVEGETFNVTRGAGHNWNDIVTAMTTLAKVNTEAQLPYVLDALDDFDRSSMQRIARFVQEAQEFLDNSHVDFPWHLLIQGLDDGLSAVFKVEGPGGWVYDKVKAAFVDRLIDELEARANPVPGLQAKLEAGVEALHHSVKQQNRHAIEAVKADLAGYIHRQMQPYQQQQDLTNDNRWIEEMVAYFGFPTRTQENVTQPILYYLDQQFDAMVTQAEQELLAAR
jgi:Putative peptidoglycan binding domain